MTTLETPNPNILNVLGISYVAYDNYREKCYTDYCHTLACQEFISFQKLHKNDFQRNYFADMWLLHVEQAFLRENAQYFTLCEPEMMRELFSAYTRNILDGSKIIMYSAPLLKEMKKRHFVRFIN